jgi:protein required for attachment to host cells
MRNMKPIELIVIANATEARLFTREREGASLSPLCEMHSPQGRRHASELGTDRPGHGSSDHYSSGVNFTPRNDAHRAEHLRFAREIAERVHQELVPGHCDRVTLFASSPFLGELRGALCPKAKNALRSSIDLDLTSFHVREIERRILDAA